MKFDFGPQDLAGQAQFVPKGKVEGGGKNGAVGERRFSCIFENVGSQDRWKNDDER